MQLKPHKAVDPIFLRKPSCETILVLPHSPCDVRCHAKIKRPMLLARQHVHARRHAERSRRRNHAARYNPHLNPSPTLKCHPPSVVPDSDPVPMVRTGGGVPLTYEPAGCTRLPFTTTPHRGHWPSPVRRGVACPGLETGSCRTPIRYPWWGREAGRRSPTNRLDVSACPSPLHPTVGTGLRQ